ncbi:TY-Chap domain-containing protein [Micromonospora zhanjiangensis]
MTRPMTWDEFAAVLADVLSRLPTGTLLKLHEVRQPVGGDYAQIWQNPGRLYVELAGNIGRVPDRRLSGQQQERLRAAGWLPLDDDPDQFWRMELDWPATTAQYRGLAEHIVAGFRDVLRLGSPNYLAYQATVGTQGGSRPLPLPELGLEMIRIEYFARLGLTDVPERPKGLLRRSRIGSSNVDEALHTDGVWRPTDTLEWADIGEIDDELRPLDIEAAEQVVRWWRTLAARAAEEEKLPPAPHGCAWRRRSTGCGTRPVRRCCRRRGCTRRNDRRWSRTCVRRRWWRSPGGTTRTRSTRTGCRWCR